MEPSGIEPLTSTLPATHVQKLKPLIYIINTAISRVFKSAFLALFLTNRTKTILRQSQLSDRFQIFRLHALLRENIMRTNLRTCTGLI